MRSRRRSGPDRPFLLTDLERVLETRGYTPNSPTLRNHLIAMTNLGEGFRVAVKGRGGRPTVFEKLR